jgi:hypothetical protein
MTMTCFKLRSDTIISERPHYYEIMRLGYVVNVASCYVELLTYRVAV